jgi:hypothetical protein
MRFVLQLFGCAFLGLGAGCQKPIAELSPLSDAGTDAGPDAGLDGGGPDAGADGGPDAGADAGPDAGADGGQSPVCEIAGVQYPTRASNPLDYSQCCNPLLSATSWTTRFAVTQTLTIDVWPRVLCSVDLDRDGWPDLLVANDLGGGPDPTQTLEVFHNDVGFFEAQASYPTGFSPWDLKVADLDGDGWPDVVLPNHDTSQSGDSVWILWNVDGGQLSAPAVFRNVDVGYAVTLGDFNEDGLIDAIVADFVNGSGSFYPGLGGAGFGPVSTFPIGGFLDYVAQGDFNEDGHLDVVFSAFSPAPAVFVAFGNGDGTFSAPIAFGEGLANWVAVGDFNGDGHADIASAYFSGGVIELYEGYGDGAFMPAVLLDGGATGEGVDSIVFADIDGDGKPELLATNTSLNQLSVFKSLDDGGILGPVTFPVTSPARLVVGDFNQDGAPDVAVLDDSSVNPGKAYVLTNQCP